MEEEEEELLWVKWAAGKCVFGPSVSLLMGRLLLGTLITGKMGKETNEIVQSGEVAVLVVAQLPFIPVVDVHLSRQWVRLGKVNQPYVRIGVVVDKQQRTADHFVSAKKLRYFKCFSD